MEGLHQRIKCIKNKSDDPKNTRNRYEKNGTRFLRDESQEDVFLFHKLNGE